MSESVMTAFSLIKARASETGSELAKKLAAVEFDKIDLHVHFPDGATPKARAESCGKRRSADRNNVCACPTRRFRRCNVDLALVYIFDCWAVLSLGVWASSLELR